MYNNNWWLCYSTITITITITLNLQLFHNFVMLKNIVCNVYPVWDMCLSHKGVSPAIVWLFIQFVSRLVVYFFNHLSLFWSSWWLVTYDPMNTAYILTWWCTTSALIQIIIMSAVLRPCFLWVVTFWDHIFMPSRLCKHNHFLSCENVLHDLVSTRLLFALHKMKTNIWYMENMNYCYY